MIPRELKPKEKLFVKAELASGSIECKVEVVSQQRPWSGSPPIIKTLVAYGMFKKGHRFSASWEELREIF